MDFFLTLLTIIGTAVFFTISVRYLADIYEEGLIHSAPMAPLALSVLVIGVSLTLLLPVGYHTIAEALSIGARWDNPYVLAIPNARAFWGDFIPAHWTVIMDNGQAGLFSGDGFTFWGLGLLASGIGLLIWARKCRTGRRYVQDFQFGPIVKFTILCAVVVFIMIQILLFLAAYLTGTFIYLASFWKIVIGLILFSFVGGGTYKVYDEYGNHVADLRER